MADRKRYGTRPAACLAGLLICAVTLVSACTVRESRADCPCTLRLYLDEVGSCYLTVRSAAGILYRDSLPQMREEYVLELPRERVFIEVTEGGSLPLRIPEGRQSPPLRWFRDTLDLPPGETELTVRPLRQYALLTVEGNDGAELFINGRVCGFGVDGALLEGDFLAEASLQGGTAVFLLPRQRDASLQLKVSLGTASSEFALGEVLEAAGYDWAAPDLAPCTLRLDLTATRMGVEADLWNRRNYRQVIL